MIAQHVCGRATRDALFLSRFDVEALPRMMIAAAVVSMVVLLAASRIMTRFGPFRIIPIAFCGSACFAFAEWLLSSRYPGLVAIAVYLHLAVFGPVVISGFWSLVNERFDPHTAKRLMRRIGAGATFGGIVGGLITGWGSFHLNVRDMLLILTLFNVLCIGGTRAMGHHRERSVRPREKPTTEKASAFRVMREVPYLQHLAVLIGLVAVTSAFLDFVFRAEAVSAFPQEDLLLRFFAIFYMAAAVLTFLVQMIASQVSLRKLGLAGTAALLPGIISFGVPASFALPALWRAVILRGLDAVLQNSLFRSGYELFYTPLAPDRKRPTKTLIDVGVDRLGQSVASLVIIIVLLNLPEGSNPLFLGLSAFTALVALLLTARLHRGYIAVLASSLRSRAVEFEESTFLDATTRTVWRSSGIARKDMVKSKAEVQAAEAEFSGTRAASPERPVVEDPLLRAIEDLRSGDRRRISRILSGRKPIDQRLVGYVIPLLGQNVLYPVVAKALRRVAHRVTGQLVDSMLDPEEDIAVRRRLPRVLKACPTQRSVEGLMLGLKDDRFNVRYHCARALMSIRKRNPEIEIPKDAVHEAALRETKVSEDVWMTQQLPDGVEDDEAPLFEEVLRKRSNRSLEHVFNILSLLLERDPLILAYRALESNDSAVRGTALEYLENVLPSEIWQGLQSHLGAAEKPKAGARSRQEIVDALRKSSDSLLIDLEELKKRRDT
ncbi:NTP/NDP exchange transporter [Acidobacteriota bacterium]